MLIPLKTIDFPIWMSKAVSLTFWNKSEQAFPGIVHPFSRKEAQFFENCSWWVECDNTSKKPLCMLEFWEFQKKVNCYWLLQQNCYKSMVFQTKSRSARSCAIARSSPSRDSSLQFRSSMDFGFCCRFLPKLCCIDPCNQFLHRWCGGWDLNPRTSTG